MTQTGRLSRVPLVSFQRIEFQAYPEEFIFGGTQVLGNHLSKEFVEDGHEERLLERLRRFVHEGRVDGEADRRTDCLDGCGARFSVDGGKLAERVADPINPGDLLSALVDFHRAGKQDINTSVVGFFLGDDLTVIERPYLAEAQDVMDIFFAYRTEKRQALHLLREKFVALQIG